MGYIRIIRDYPPYALMDDRRGFVSMRFGTGGHSGIDTVGNAYGNPVCAILDGKVTAIGWSKTLGNVLEYGNGAVLIKHYHLSSIAVAVGQTVEAGRTKLGTEGSTGSAATGKHLHTSILIHGQLVDPEPYMDGRYALPTKGDDLVVIRKVIKPLNLRNSRSLASSANIVAKDMPKGTKLLVTETTTEDGITWGHVATVINGQMVSGWSNLGAEWSVEE